MGTDETEEAKSESKEFFEKVKHKAEGNDDSEAVELADEGIEAVDKDNPLTAYKKVKKLSEKGY